MRAGSEYFLEPSDPAQRRYEAMRAYFVDGLAAAAVAERFGYSPASVHQMASELRAGSARYFRSSKPGPRSARKADRVRDRVLGLRAEDRSVEEIAAALVSGWDAGVRADGLDDPSGGGSGAPPAPCPRRARRGAAACGGQGASTRGVAGRQAGAL